VAGEPRAVRGEEADVARLRRATVPRGGGCGAGEQGEERDEHRAAHVQSPVETGRRARASALRMVEVGTA
jgi:hypothetical protein